MKHLIKITIVSLAAAIVLFAAFHYMRAQGASTTTAPKSPKALPATITADPSVPHVLIASYMTDASPAFGTPESAGNFTIDNKVTFKCLLPCTLEWEQSAQLGVETYTSNLLSLGVILDGSDVPQPFIGETATDGSYTTFNYTESLHLAPGIHTIQSYGWSLDGVYLGYYHNNYRVYVP